MISMTHRIQFQNKMNFLQLDAELWTDRTFPERFEDHTGKPLFEILPKDVVHRFPLDYMHIPCLDLMQSLLSVWILA